MTIFVLFIANYIWYSSLGFVIHYTCFNIWFFSCISIQTIYIQLGYESCSVSCHRLMTTDRAWLFIHTIFNMLYQLSSSHNNDQSIYFQYSAVNDMSSWICIRYSICLSVLKNVGLENLGFIHAPISEWGIAWFFSWCTKCIYMENVVSILFRKCQNATMYRKSKNTRPLQRDHSIRLHENMV